MAIERGVLGRDAAALLAPYLKRTTSGMPWVILKWAQSLDGRIATHTGDSRWIGDAAQRMHAHRVRGRVDAIVVGVETVVRDDPRLTCRLARPRRIAARVVLDTHLRTPATAQVVRSARQTPTILVCGPAAPRRREGRLGRLGCAVIRVPTRGGRVSLPHALRALAQRSATNVLVEGGGAVLGSFIDQSLVDELHVYMSPLLIGGCDATSALEGQGVERVAGALRLSASHRLRKLGGGYFVCDRPGLESAAVRRAR
jgi:diaminohydroxyphosphoribosylaminopyrimidine deaminase/5-amino-6-(5-phosphoribosylamino)uracil reductase